MYHKRSQHRGTTITEAVATVALAMMVVVGVSQLLNLVARQWSSAEQRSLALREASNVLEDLLSCPWAELTASQPAAREVSSSAQLLLPQARLAVTAGPEAKQSDAWKIRVEVSWLDQSGRRSPPVQLTAWRYRTEEVRP